VPSGPVIDTRTDAIFVNMGGGGVVKVQPAAADQAFQAALALLPRSGGVLHVAPGSAPYVFQSAVVVSLPDVRIEFAGGPAAAGLAFPARGGPSELLRIAASRFRCRGAVVRHTAAQGGGADDGRACFRVVDAHGARFEECRFELEQASADLLGFSAVRAEGGSELAPIEGLRLSECTFLIRAGTRSAVPSGTGEPRGVVCLRARNVAGVRVEACIARGEQQGTRNTHCGTVLFLDHCPGSVVTDFSARFLDLGTAALSKEAEPVVRMLTHGGHDGHRSTIVRTVFEDLGARTAIQLEDARSVVVAHANFGRIVPYARSVIEVLGLASRGLVVHGVNFHNVSASQLEPEPLQNAMLDLQGAQAATISGNVFAAFDGTQAYLRTAPDTCADIVLGAATARRATGGGLTPQGPLPPA
jgi:hypothetical protein